jgi:hypothetical protein
METCFSVGFGYLREDVTVDISTVNHQKNWLEKGHNF